MAEKKDYTKGPLFKNIVLFSLPLIASGLLQFLFNSADQIVIGQFASKESLAAVGSNGALISLLLNLFIGLSVGTNVIMARAIGERNDGKAERVVHTSILLGVICGVVMTVFCFFMARTFLVILKCDADVIDKATTYLKIYFLGMPATIIYDFGAAVLRAKGDTKRPLIFLAVAGALNVVLNLFFVIVCKMDVAGVALATIISQYLSCALVIICLIKETDLCKLTLKKLKLHKQEIKEIAFIGIPSGLNGVCFSLGNIIMQSAVNTLGSTAMAAGTVASTLDGFIYIAMNSVSQSVVTFVGQNYGAHKTDRIKKVLLESLGFVVAVGIVLTGIELLFLRPLISLFSTDADVIDKAARLMSIYIPLYFMCGVMDVLVGALRGIGKTIFPTVVSIVFVCVFRVIWTFTVFPLFLTLEGLYISHPISWTLCSIINAISFAVYYKKLKKENADKEEVTENTCEVKD